MTRRFDANARRTNDLPAHHRRCPRSVSSFSFSIARLSATIKRSTASPTFQPQTSDELNETNREWRSPTLQEGIHRSPSVALTVLPSILEASPSAAVAFVAVIDSGENQRR